MDNNELYHYYGGSQYMHGYNELYHYGVPGMKWGKRKAKYDVEIAKLQERQKHLRTNRGVTSAKFQKTALKLDKMKAKRELLDAKINQDDVAKAKAKEKLKGAKQNDDVRNIKGMKLTDQELKALKRQDIRKAISSVGNAIKKAVAVEYGRRAIYNLLDSVDKKQKEEKEKKENPPSTGVTYRTTPLPQATTVGEVRKNAK